MTASEYYPDVCLRESLRLDKHIVPLMVHPSKHEILQEELLVCHFSPVVIDCWDVHYRDNGLLDIPLCQLNVRMSVSQKEYGQVK